MKLNVNTRQKNDPKRQTEAKWKNAVRSNKSKFEILYAQHAHWILWPAEEKDHWACFQRSDESLLLVRRECISAQGSGAIKGHS